MGIDDRLKTAPKFWQDTFEEHRTEYARLLNNATFRHNIDPDAIAKLMAFEKIAEDARRARFTAIKLNRPQATIDRYDWALEED